MFIQTEKWINVAINVCKKKNIVIQYKYIVYFNYDKRVTVSKRIHINKKLRYDIDQKENFKIRNEKISFIK